MKRFVTELTGKTVMTDDGRILGVIENLIVDTRSGHVQDVLVAPAEDIDARTFRVDPQGKLLLPFQGMKAIRDVVVMDLG
ncbi:MAG: PRC-barrel domain-containing protein [Candidatus Thermoplasmatota archaeon]|nr:PRC-barrel domain-containing protein [Candidatus Thermoplasmatota archaeon]